MKKVIVIAGPTAVGKTSFSIELAKRYGLEIISGDSIQVYKGLDIGSGKVTKEEMNGVKHHLIDILSPKDAYNVSIFQKMARELIDTSEKPMIICGGTGLYLKACLYDYSFENEKEEAYDPELEKYTNEELYAMLEKSDPIQATKIHPNNRRRVMRSLTIQKNTGKTQSEIEKEQKHELLYDAIIIGCTMDREKLYERINMRVEKMFEDGLENEIKTLLDEGVTFTDTCMEGIGYKEWKDYFQGNMTEDKVKHLIQKNSRNFAKRQYTWFKHQMPVRWYDVTNKDDDIYKEVDSFLKD
jgi:tRNA dimethylallyltransferase